MIIAIDIGASKVKVGTFDIDHRAVRLLGVKRYLTKDWSGPLPLLLAHLAGGEMRGRGANLDAIAIGVAGPVPAANGEVTRLTNLQWVIDPDEIRRQTSCLQVFVVNDLVAHAYGTISLQQDQYTTLQAGPPRRGNRAVIAAGSGLGEGIIAECEGGFVPLPSEGGHADFSPRNKLETGLLAFLLGRYPEHVSWERVISGKYGFRNIFDFILATEPQIMNRNLIDQVHGVQDVGSIVVDAANNGDEGAAKVLKLFTTLYGAEAGNLALKALPIGGLFISGGIVRRILPWISSGTFMASFLAKGRMKPLLHEIPVHVVLDSDSAVKGLAYFANTQLLKVRVLNF